MSNIQVTVPESQVHVTETPALKPFYQELKITPINNVTEIVISENNASTLISFDIPGENVVNFYDSYLTYDMTLPKYEISTVDYANLEEKKLKFPQIYHGNVLVDQASNYEMQQGIHYYYEPTGVKCALRNSFGIDSIKVYNSNGVNLFYVDKNYNDYIDFMRMLARSETTEINNDKQYFDGCELFWDPDLHRYVVEDLSSFDSSNNPVNNVFKNEVKWYNGIDKVKVKLYFKELFNSILSTRSDLRFFEKIKIDIKFGTIKQFAYGFIDCVGEYTNPLTGYIDHPHQKIIDPNSKLSNMKLSNFNMMLACNQDYACNENTINYLCTHEIDINDFHVNSTYIQACNTEHMNYQFNINASMGPYLKFVLYRNLDELGNPFYWDEGSNMRWYVNDFPWSLDYIRVNPQYESFQKLIKRIKNSYYNNNRREYFTENFFELLDFSNESLINMSSRSGRALNEELKLTLEANNFTWYRLDSGTNIGHRFYIITGRLLKLNEHGIEAVI